MAFSKDQIDDLLSKKISLPPYKLGSEKIKEFAESVQNFNAVHYDFDFATALGYKNILMPPTMLGLIGTKYQKQLFEFLLPDLDISKILHVEQKFNFIRPICAEEELILEAKISSFKSVAGMNMFVVESDVLIENVVVANILGTFINKEDVQVDDSVPVLAKEIMKHGSV